MKSCKVGLFDRNHKQHKHTFYHIKRIQCLPRMISSARVRPQHASMKFPLPDDADNAENRAPVDMRTFEALLAQEAQVPPTPSSAHQPCDCTCAQAARMPLLSVALGAAEAAKATTQPSSTTREAPTRPTTPAPPTAGALLAAVTASHSPPPTTHADLTLVAYDSDAPTIALRLTASVSQPVHALLDALRASLPCAVSRPGGLLFVHDTIYADDREPGSTDYATPIATFLDSRTTHTPHIVSLARIAPRLRDLHPRLGLPYLFQHDGDCEHRLIFTDVHATSSPAITIDWRRPPRVHACDVCALRAARHCIFHDRIAERSPAYYCHACHLRAHYTQSLSLYADAGDLCVIDLPPPLPPLD